MLIIIICAVTGAIVHGVWMWKEEEDIPWAIGFGFFGILVGGFVGFIISLLLMIPAGEPIITQQSIIALKDNSDIEGSFFLGCGTIEEKMYYYYMADNGDGGYKMEKVEAEDSCIYEDNISTPYVIISTRHAKLAPWLALDI